jgi:hypothetical protein
MELSVIALTLTMSIAVALVGTYVAVSLVLFCVRRAVIRSEERPIELPLGTALRIPVRIEKSI